MRSLRVEPAHLSVCVSEKWNLGAQRIEIKQARLESVVQIGCVVGNLVNVVDELRFDRRLQIEQILGQLRRGDSVAE